MASFGNVTSVVERPVGTTLAVAATAGDPTITVDDISKLTWPAGGLRIGNDVKIYSIDAAPDQSVNVIDQDEDDEGSDEVGTITLGGSTLGSDYDVDEPVIQWLTDDVTERIATVLLPDQAEELVLRVPRHLWDRLPSDIRDRDGAAEAVALENVDGQWVMTDVVSEDPSVDASFINAATLPTQTSPTIAGTGADIATFFDEVWLNPSRVTADDGSYATATGTSATPTVTPHNTGFKLPATATDDGSAGTVAWNTVNAILHQDGNTATALGAGTTERLQATDFGFAVPGGATITGVTVEITRAGLARHVVDDVVKLIKGGAIVGTDNSSPANWPNSLAPATYGGDLWGTTLTPADVNASDFGVNLQATSTGASTSAQVDSIRVKVSYTTTSGSSFRSNTHFIEASNFTFSPAIPDESTITGITAEVQRHASDDTGDDYAADNQVRLTNGTDTSNDVGTAQHWPTSDAIATYGGDLWGLTWTADQINDPAFGLVVSADVNFGVTASIDFIRITVAYVTAGDA